MKTISISEAKATLSEQIRHVKRGEEVILTERGKPVARLVPIGDKSTFRGTEELVAAGLLRLGTGSLPRGFWRLPRPSDPGAAVRGSVREDREEGW
jgi:prevent-host-death family protein